MLDPTNEYEQLKKRYTYFAQKEKKIKKKTR